jgi:hypothetical protein
VIKQLRSDAKVYLGIKDYRSLPLTRVYEKLQHSEDYKKKRNLKLMLKENKGDL